MDEDSAFDEIIRSIEHNRKFQKRFNFFFNFVLPFLATLPYFNSILALAVPDHWCKIPGREYTNISIEEWRNMYLPPENGTTGLSKCKMYNYTGENQREVIDCQYGWDFDTTWYDRTVATQENWICENSLHVTNALVFGRIGEVIGTFIFGQLADTIGRRPVFFITLFLLVLGRLLLIVTSSSIPLFFFMTFIGGLSSLTIFQTILIISMETTTNENRATPVVLQYLGWTLSLCILPLVMWAVGDWIHFILITTLPVTVYFFSGPFLFESPRWLASKGKLNQCIRELKKIAKVNKCVIPADLINRLTCLNRKKEKGFGVLGLFSSWRLLKNTFILVFQWSACIVVYYALTINVLNLGGNPFLNFFLQGLFELPSYIIAKYTCDYFGRRFSNIGAFLATLIGCIPIIFIIQDETKSSIVSMICIFLKFSISFVFYGVNLQSMETFPTCVRQSGFSFMNVIGNSFGIISPYMVYAGLEINATYPYMMIVALCLTAAILGVFIPETYNKKLPETLDEAAQFGVNQNIFGVEKPQHVECEEPLKVS